MSSFIYQIRNLVNNKIYIGSTFRPLYKRKYEHFSDLRNNRHCNGYLQKSFNKYKEENFILEIIETFKFPENYTADYIAEYLIGRELYLVDELEAEYNLRKDATRGKPGYRHSIETRKKISDGQKRRPKKEKIKPVLKVIKTETSWKHIPESLLKIKERSLRSDNREHIRKIQKLSTIARIGTHQTQESIRAMLITKFGSLREIQIFNSNGEQVHSCFTSREAANFTGVKRSNIGNNLCNITKTAGGYIFKYKTNNNGELD